MANSSTGNPIYLCHFCSDEFSNRATLVAHFSQCQINKSSKQLNVKILQSPQLNQTQRDILYMVKLHPSTNQFSSNNVNHHVSPNDLNLQIPLSNLYSHGYLSSSKQSSFDDSYCISNNTQTYIPIIDDNDDDERLNSNLLNDKILTYHIYKYSRRERDRFYARIKRTIMKKHIPSIRNKSRSKEPLSSIFSQTNSIINIPTKIHSRQRINSNSNNIYPLLFSPHFHTLVKLPTNKIFRNYLFNIRIYFHLIHSIASQEFQIIVNSNDNQHHVSYTAYSFVNVLRQTMADYTASLQKTFKRNYFQSFQHQDQQIMTPSKVRRYDQSTSSSSLIQIDDNNHHLENQTNDRLPPPTTIMNNFIQIDDNNSVIHPVPSDLILINHRQSTDRTSTQPIITSFIPIMEEQKPNRKSPSPIFVREQKLEPIQIDEPNFSIQRTPIRLMNGSNHNKKQPSSRKKPSNSVRKPDENSVIKATRMSTRQNSIKTEIITEIYPTFETKPVILSASQISEEWLTNTVFYRCHACSHEEFFLVLSRECMILHISSKHGNMEENFKQRISHFLTNKGRSLKIFQHFLKWQQPWSEKQIEQIFKLAK